MYLAPDMAEGEFARYFIAVSLAVIAGRLLGFGSHEDLVFRIKHNVKRISYYLRGAVVYYLLAWAVLLFSLFAAGENKLLFAAFAYSLLISGNGFLTGSLRSYSNLFQEFNANIPWLLVCLFGGVLGAKEATDVLYFLVISYTLVFIANIVAAYTVGIKCGVPSTRVVVTQLLRYKAWLPKSLSSVGIAANLRSYPLWLSALGYVLSDGLAYAFSIGEVIYQLCMVYVHQIHSSYRRHKEQTTVRRLLNTGVVMLVLALIIPVPVYLGLKEA